MYKMLEHINKKYWWANSHKFVTRTKMSLYCTCHFLCSNNIIIIIATHSGDGPIIPDCTAATGSNVLFPDDGGVVAPGCDICIQRGSSVTLDCTVSAGTPPISYSWTMNGEEVSRNPRLVVTQAGNYSCSASNLDNDPVVEASILFCMWA